MLKDPVIKTPVEQSHVHHQRLKGLCKSKQKLKDAAGLITQQQLAIYRLLCWLNFAIENTVADIKNNIKGSSKMNLFSVTIELSKHK